MGFFDWLPWNKKERTPEELAEIRRVFAVRYDHFRLLIQANTRAHELIGELEEALRGFTPYGIQYVQTLCTRISTAIFQMVRHLGELDSRGHEELLDALERINQRIMAVLEPEKPETEGELVIDLTQVGRDHADLCGPKMAMLGEAGNVLKLNIPTGFVITVAAFHRFMETQGLRQEVDRLIQTTESEDRDALFRSSSKIMQLVMDTQLPEDLATAILAAYDDLSEQLGRPPDLAVRSSALGEDMEGSSYAGQYRSVLNVDRSSLLNSYKEVVASKYTRQAMAYRINRGIRDYDVAMSVGCMTMVDSMAGGGGLFTQSGQRPRRSRLNPFGLGFAPSPWWTARQKPTYFMFIGTHSPSLTGTWPTSRPCSYAVRRKAYAAKTCWKNNEMNRP